MKPALLVLLTALASAGSHAAAVEQKLPPAVAAFDPQEGFKLSDRGLKAMGVSFGKIQGRSPWQIPTEALVRIKHSTGVYRRYEGWITLVLVNVVKKGPEGYVVSSEDLQDGDEFATHGVPYLRMTESDLNSDTVDSCSH